jgi:hypothetical protein
MVNTPARSWQCPHARHRAANQSERGDPCGRKCRPRDEQRYTVAVDARRLGYGRSLAGFVRGLSLFLGFRSRSFTSGPVFTNILVPTVIYRLPESPPNHPAFWIVHQGIRIKEASPQPQ